MADTTIKAQAVITKRVELLSSGQRTVELTLEISGVQETLGGALQWRPAAGGPTDFPLGTEFDVELKRA
ncbi:MAG: hypothetical protein ACREQL_02800 [Candidatus Binatia bacterium]